MSRTTTFTAALWLILAAGCGRAPDNTFNHFPIEGQHSGLACSDCHSDRLDDLLPGCTQCHSEARPDGHFSGDCVACHNSFSWEEADFDHDRFFRLPHEGVNDCASCHLQDDGYATFSCIDCHEHSRNNTDPEHRGIINYRYASEACLECHPDGQE